MRYVNGCVAVQQQMWMLRDLCLQPVASSSLPEAGDSRRRSDWQLDSAWLWVTAYRMLCRGPTNLWTLWSSCGASQRGALEGTKTKSERSITPVWLYTNDRLHGWLCSLWLLWVKGTVRRALVASLRCEPVALITHACNAARVHAMSIIPAQNSACSSTFILSLNSQLRWCPIIKLQIYGDLWRRGHLSYTVTTNVYDSFGSRRYQLLINSLQMF